MFILSPIIYLMYKIFLVKLLSLFKNKIIFSENGYSNISSFNICMFLICVTCFIAIIKMLNNILSKNDARGTIASTPDYRRNVFSFPHLLLGWLYVYHILLLWYKACFFLFLFVGFLSGGIFNFVHGTSASIEVII